MNKLLYFFKVTEMCYKIGRMSTVTVFPETATIGRYVFYELNLIKQSESLRQFIGATTVRLHSVSTPVVNNVFSGKQQGLDSEKTEPES
jgi:hypothetical protein